MQSEGQDRWLKVRLIFLGGGNVFLSRTKNCQKRLLASSCQSVRVAPVCAHRTTRLPRDIFGT